MKTIQACVEMLRKHSTSRPKSILDSGCGTGMVGEYITNTRTIGPPQILTGIDISNDSINEASLKNVYIKLAVCDLQAP